MFVTPLPIVTLVNPVQYAKASLLMLVTPLPSITLGIFNTVKDFP